MKKQLKRIVAFLVVALLLFTQMPLVFAQSAEVDTIIDSKENPCLFDLSEDSFAPQYISEDIPHSEEYVVDDLVAADFIRTQLKNREPEFVLHFEVPRIVDSKDEAVKMIWDFLDLAIGETEASDEGDYLRFCYKSKSISANRKIVAEQNKTQFDITYTMQYFTTFAQEQQVTAKIKEVIESFGFTDETTEYKKVRTIHDYIVDNIVYDYENLENEDYLLKFSAYAALLNKTSVCEGYATLFYRMLKEVGLDARVITGYGGKITPDVQLTENHAWNIVRVGDVYYYVDSTWDAERHDCKFFLKGEKDFPEHAKIAYYNTSDFKKAYPISDHAIPCEYGSDWVKVDEEYHVPICKNCNTPGEQVKHRLNNKNACEDCGYNLDNVVGSVKLSQTSYTYDGKTKTPDVIVKNYVGKTLKEGTDYSVSYPSDRKSVGTYKVTVTMKGAYSGKYTLSFKINPISLSKCKVYISAISYTYDGKTKTPTIKIKNQNGTTLKKDTHYTLSYSSGRKYVGTYKVTIKMKGNYGGTGSVSFKINPPKTSVSKLTAGKKSIAVSISKKSSQVSGYQIEYSTSKKFTKAKTKTLSSYKTTKYTLKSLSAKKTYYVRVRTYKTVGKTKYYSSWSSYKYVKTK